MTKPTESQLSNARVRARAKQRLQERHLKEFEELLHEEKHADGYRHLHGPDNPETIDWWGPARGD